MDMTDNMYQLVAVSVPWSELPQDLLELIMALVSTSTLVDLLQCRGVCHTWRHAALNLLSRHICNATANPLLTTTPLLLQFQPRDSHRSKLLCLFESIRYLSKDSGDTLRSDGWQVVSRKNTEKYQLPEPKLVDLLSNKYGEMCIAADSASVSTVENSTRYIGTYRGWLLMYSSNFGHKLYIYNPLTRLIAQIPPPPKINMWNQSWMYDPMFITSSTPTDPNCMLYLYCRDLYKIGIYSMGDNQWTCTFDTKYYWADMILYKSELYSIDELGVLRRSLFDHNYSDHKEEVVSNTSSVEFDRNGYRYYLVESWCGELLMVKRRLEELPTFYYKVSTNLIMTFKLNWSNGEWEEVTSFGDQALFLTCNGSKFVSVRYNPKYIPNSIYFIDDSGFVDRNSCSEDFGVYDLTNRKVQPLKLSHRQMHSYTFYRWYLPGL